jgi:hypothetical protein
VLRREKVAAPTAQKAKANPAEQVGLGYQAVVLMMEYYKRHGKLIKIKEILVAIPGATKSSLYRDKVFAQMRKDLASALRIPKGSKSADGDVEAEAD